MKRKPHEVLATREAREQLPSLLLAQFRAAGADAEPVVIGARRRPEGVVLSYERYLKLLEGHERRASGRFSPTGQHGVEAWTTTRPCASRSASNAPPVAECRASSSTRERLRRGAPGAACAQVLLRWTDGEYELVVSPMLLAELERVLRRPSSPPRSARPRSKGSSTHCARTPSCTTTPQPNQG